jgi:hypothetical protein
MGESALTVCGQLETALDSNEPSRDSQSFTSWQLLRPWLGFCKANQA